MCPGCPRKIDGGPVAVGHPFAKAAVVALVVVVIDVEDVFPEDVAVSAGFVGEEVAFPATGCAVVRFAGLDVALAFVADVDLACFDRLVGREVCHFVLLGYG
ncbi:hypothetical protein D3C79_997430 [compost metagenome]